MLKSQKSEKIYYINNPKNPKMLKKKKIILYMVIVKC